MKKISYWVLSASVIVGIGVAGFNLSSPQSAGAAVSLCTPIANTVTVWGEAGTCTDARFNANQLATGLAQERCVVNLGGEICTFSLVEDAPECWFNGNSGLFQMPAHGVYNCFLF